MVDSNKNELEDTNLDTPEVTPLEMSDEDILNMTAPGADDEPLDLNADPADTSTDDDEKLLPEDKKDEDNKDEDEDEDLEKIDDKDPDDKTDLDLDDQAQIAAADAAKKAESEDLKDTDDAEENTDAAAKTDTKDNDDDTADGESKDSPKVNYQSEYEKLLAPFRANGREIKVESVDDALKLMQMGANYNKKMAGLKPNLKLLKMLENNGLLDESKIARLIDLEKKDPKAIAQFLKDSNIDPMDIDTKKDTEYTPGTYTVDEKEVDLDSVLDDIQDTPAFKETIDIVSNKWDDSSKKELLDEPGILRVINAHVDSGIYKQITEKVENERMLGNLTGLSDLEAYQKVGDAMQEQGVFTKAATTAKDDNTDLENLDTKTAKKPDAEKDPKLIDRKKAAASPKSGGKKSKEPLFDPLALSDEEFEKAAASFRM